MDIMSGYFTWLLTRVTLSLDSSPRRRCAVLRAMSRNSMRASWEMIGTSDHTYLVAYVAFCNGQVPSLPHRFRLVSLPWIPRAVAGVGGHQTGLPVDRIWAHGH